MCDAFVEYILDVNVHLFQVCVARHPCVCLCVCVCVCVCVCGASTAEASERENQRVHDSWRRRPGGTSCQDPQSVGVL